MREIAVAGVVMLVILVGTEIVFGVVGRTRKKAV